MPCAWPAREVRGFCEPRKPATRRLIPAGIPRADGTLRYACCACQRYGEMPVTSVDARELGCWSFYRVNALTVIEQSADPDGALSEA